MGQALEIAEDNRCAKPVRQPGELVVEDCGVLVPLHGRFNRLVGHEGRARPGRPVTVALLGLVPPRQSGNGLAGCPDGHAVEPVAQQLRVAKAPCLASQDEEDGLERVLGEVRIAQVITANAQDHRPVPRHQCGEGILGLRAATLGEPFE